MLDSFFSKVKIFTVYKNIPVIIRRGMNNCPCGYFIFDKEDKVIVNNIDEHVHGGVTFKENIDIPEEFLSSFNSSVKPGSYFIVGFDMAHSYDIVNGQCVRTITDCMNELIRVIDIFSS